MISLTTTIFGIVAIAVFLWRRRKLYILSWQVGGPMSWPVVGNIAYFMNERTFLSNGLSICKTFPKWYRIWVGPHLVIVLNQPQHAEIVLKSPDALEKGYFYQLFNITVGGEGLFSSKGEHWKSHRKLLNPTVQHFSLLNSFEPIFNAHLRKLVGKMKTDLCAGEIDIYPVIERCTLDTVCETTFGSTLIGDESETLSFLENANELMSVSALFCTKPWYYITPIFWMSKDYGRMKRSQLITHDYATKMVLRKVKEFKSSNKASGHQEQKMRNNFIDECLRLSMESQSFTNENLKVESITMLLAGFETTALTVSYALLMLAMHPECQQKVFEELRTLFPDQSSNVSMSDLGQLTYTTNCIKETMRLHPAGPLISRKITKELKIDNVIFPVGLEVVIPIINIHRNQTVWGPNADQFNPDNFLPENIGARHPSAFLAFSIGSRNCIGNKYALMVVRMFVCWLVRNFRFSTSLRLDDINYKFSMTLKTFDGHLLEVHRREEY